MVRKGYSAGAVKLSFWFSEFKKVVTLLNSGKTMKDIRQMSIDENIFAAPTVARALQIFNAVADRIGHLDKSFYSIFEGSDIATQKIIALISIMNVDSLFFDFIYEIYREKIIVGINRIIDSDIRIFFKDKQLQSDKVARWTDYTLHRLGTCYKTMLMEAGVIDQASGDRSILKPILDRRLEDCLKVNEMRIFINALTGVR